MKAAAAILAILASPVFADEDVLNFLAGQGYAVGPESHAEGLSYARVTAFVQGALDDNLAVRVMRLTMVFDGGSSPMSLAGCAARAASQPFLRDLSTSVPSGLRFPPVRREFSSGSGLLCPLIIGSGFPKRQHEHGDLAGGGDCGFAEPASPDQTNGPRFECRETFYL